MSTPLVLEDPPQPVFVVGAARSGTTMLGERLGRLSGCLCIPESQFIEEALSKSSRDPNFGVSSVLAMISGHFRFSFWGIADKEIHRIEKNLPADLSSLIVELVRTKALAESHRSVKFWIDHTPSNLRILLRLKKLFPKARFIYILRDGRAVAASLQKIRDWGPRTVLGQARSWTSSVAHGFAAKEKIGDCLCIVKYEDLILNEKVELERLAQFIGVPLLNPTDSPPGFIVHGYTENQHSLVGAALDPRRIDAWKKDLSMHDIELFESMTGDLLEMLGYQTIFGASALPLKTLPLAKMMFKEFVTTAAIKPFRKRLRRWKYRTT